MLRERMAFCRYGTATGTQPRTNSMSVGDCGVGGVGVGGDAASIPERIGAVGASDDDGVVREGEDFSRVRGGRRTRYEAVALGPTILYGGDVGATHDRCCTATVASTTSEPSSRTLWGLLQSPKPMQHLLRVCRPNDSFDRNILFSHGGATSIRRRTVTPRSMFRTSDLTPSPFRTVANIRHDQPAKAAPSGGVCTKKQCAPTHPMLPSL